MAIDDQSTRQSRTAQGGNWNLESDHLLDADSTATPKISFVLPTLNEEEGIVECIESVRKALRDLDTTGEVIVSDSSTDRTPQIAREMGAIVVEPDGTGYGYAYQYGFQFVRGEYIVMGDADTTYNFEELPKLLTLVEDGEADIAMGSRLDGEIESDAMPPLHQYVGNPLLTRFLNLFYDADVSDAHSGFRVLSRDALERLDCVSPGMEFASEMVMDASVKGLRIEEVPITYSERKGEATLDSFRDGWRHVKFMLQNSPGYLFTLPSMVFILVGVSALVMSVLGEQAAGLVFGTHTAIAGSLLVIVGFEIGSLGLYSTVAAEPIREPDSPLIRAILRNFRLEHGATIGLVLSGLGGGYVLLMAARYATSGSLPFVVWNMVAFTTLIIGIQLIFQSFFLSMIVDARDRRQMTTPQELELADKTPDRTI